MKVLLAAILTLASTCFLQAENPSFRTGKRSYRESVCKYKEVCTDDFCLKHESLPCECQPNSEETRLAQLTQCIFALYDLIADDEQLCKYEKKCYQYGYCPSCKCDMTQEDLEKVVEILKEVISDDENEDKEPAPASLEKDKDPASATH